MRTEDGPENRSSDTADYRPQYEWRNRRALADLVVLNWPDITVLRHDFMAFPWGFALPNNQQLGSRLSVH